MSFWDSFSSGLGDSVDALTDKYLEYERIKAEAGAAAELAEQNAIMNRPDSITQMPNSMPSQPSGYNSVTSGSGQGAGTGLISIGGVQLNSTALYVGLGALALALVLKVAR